MEIHSPRDNRKGNAVLLSTSAVGNSISAKRRERHVDGMPSQGDRKYNIVIDWPYWPSPNRQGKTIISLNNTIDSRKRVGLELANPRTEVLTLGEGPESWACGIDTLKGQVVTTPADFDTLLLQGEEYDQGGDRDGARESGGGDAEMK